jgi:HK97 family phage prohead protease
MRYCPTSQLKELLPTPESVLPDDVLLIKMDVLGDVQPQGDSRQVRFVISTGAVDRDRDVIDPQGWQLDNYRKNPVVLWAHNSWDLPIARTLEMGVSGDQLTATAEFAGADVYPFADTVYQLLKGGYLRATSVGFRPLTYNYNDARGGIDFSTQELLEFSVCPVPANPQCLMDAKRKGVELTPLKSWAEQVLDQLSDEPGLWLPKSQVEHVFSVLSTRTVTSGQWPVAREDGEQISLSPQATSHKPLATLPPSPAVPPSPSPASASAPEAASLSPSKGVAPADVSRDKAPEDTVWTAPTLSDFTDGAWSDLTSDVQRHIAGHFAWAAAMTPEAYGDCKLPHHEAHSGAIVWRGVANAAARLAQSSIPDGDIGKVQAHLSRHYRAFGKTPPWEAANAAAWDAYVDVCRAVTDAEGDAVLHAAASERRMLLEAQLFPADEDPDQVVCDVDEDPETDALLTLDLDDATADPTDAVTFDVDPADLQQSLRAAVSEAMMAVTGRLPY